MKKSKAESLIEELLHEIEEEDIGISLLNTFYQGESELCFFQPGDKQRVHSILKVLSEDSLRHKTMLLKLIDFLEGLKNA